MTDSSSPIETKSYAIGNKSAEEVIPLGAKGATSYSYLVRIEGKEHFMKQLRPELKDDWRYRSAYQKEYEVGRSIASEYIVKYEAIDENADGLYLLAEYVKGWNIEEKIAQEPPRWRDECKLMVLDRKTGEIEHKVFKNIIDYLECMMMLKILLVLL